MAKKEEKPKPYLIWLKEDEIAQAESFLTSVKLSLAEERTQFKGNRKRIIGRLELMESVLYKIDQLAVQYEEPHAGFYFRQMLGQYYKAVVELTNEYVQKFPHRETHEIKVGEMIQWCENYQFGSSRHNQRRHEAIRKMLFNQ